MMMQADTGEDSARRRAHAGEKDGGSGGIGDGEGGSGREGATRDGDSAGAEEGSEWGRLMGECSEEGGDAGHGPISGGGDAAEQMVGVGRARERAGPGKQRRVVTLARWEPSARAHMLTCLENATIDVTGD